jgi:hypothetical protein
MSPLKTNYLKQHHKTYPRVMQTRPLIVQFVRISRSLRRMVNRPTIWTEKDFYWSKKCIE